QEFPVIGMRVIQVERATHGFDGAARLVQFRACESGNGVILRRLALLGGRFGLTKASKGLLGMPSLVLRQRQLDQQTLLVWVPPLERLREVLNRCLPLLLIELGLAPVEVGGTV